MYNIMKLNEQVANIINTLRYLPSLSEHEQLIELCKLIKITNDLRKNNLNQKYATKYKKILYRIKQQIELSGLSSIISIK